MDKIYRRKDNLTLENVDLVFHFKEEGYDEPIQIKTTIPGENTGLSWFHTGSSYEQAMDMARRQAAIVNHKDEILDFNRKIKEQRVQLEVEGPKREYPSTFEDAFKKEEADNE